MAHELSFKRGGKAEMAYVGETPWHKFGQRLTEGAPLEVWKTEAGFDWQALSAPVQFTHAGELHTFGDKQVIFRSDTGAPLSVMGDGYKIVQPAEVLEFFRDLTEQGGWKLHTAGMLRGGRKMWALARNHTEGEVVDGDQVKGNLLLATSLDGTMPTVACMTAIRVVCANTLRLALDGAFMRSRNQRLGAVKDGQTAVKVSHRSQFDAEAVKRDMGLARDAFDVFMAQARVLAQEPCDMEEAREILRRIFGQPHQSRGATKSATDGRALLTMNANAGAALAATEGGSLLSSLLAKDNATGEMREQKSVARALALFAGEGMGATHAGVQGTRWGLFNAITEHIDHEQGRTAETRLESSWFGRGDDFKQSALVELLKA